jgi:hybrid cluster-associated redox disulfide protein
MTIRPNRLVADVLSDAPATLRVFLDFHMRCVGCPIASFHTLADAAREHNVDLDRFLAALHAAATVPALGFAPPPVAGEQTIERG